MSNEEGKLLIQIAQMYYLENKTQMEISRELHIHRSMISRLLKQSREKGIVKIVINYDKAGTGNLEEKIVAEYGIEKAIVVPAAEGMDTAQIMVLLGEKTCEYLVEILQDDMILGFSWGAAMHGVANGMAEIQKKGITCVPLVGGPSGIERSDYHVNAIVYEASRNLNGRALLIDAPAFPETAELKRSLLESDYNKMLIDYWRKLDVALFGIGSPSMIGSERWSYFYGDKAIPNREDIAGDVLSRFFDSQGRPLESDLDDRVIGIDLTDLLRVRYRIAVAESLQKLQAIQAALRGGYITALVTTQETAEALVR